MHKSMMTIGFLGIGMAIPTSTLAQDTENQPMSFFVTSSSHSGDLGGLEGADAICQSLAIAVGAGDLNWRAYLSTHGTRQKAAVNARDRIGAGPWFNAKGTLIAANLADLHGDIQRDSNLIMGDTALTEKGDVIPGRIRADGTQNEHDILTGSDTHGRAFIAGAMRFKGSSEAQCRIGRLESQATENI